MTAWIDNIIGMSHVTSVFSQHKKKLKAKLAYYIAKVYYQIFLVGQFLFFFGVRVLFVPMLEQRFYDRKMAVLHCDVQRTLPVLLEGKTERE